MKFDEKEVTKMALQLPNVRLTKEEKEQKVELPRLHYLKDFEDRARNGGPLSFLEARCLVRETLTFDKYKIQYYEMAQFPKTAFFDTEAEAEDFFTMATVEGRHIRGFRMSAQRMELYNPKDRIYGKRKVIKEWKSPEYKPDPMSFGYR